MAIQVFNVELIDNEEASFFISRTIRQSKLSTVTSALATWRLFRWPVKEGKFLVSVSVESHLPSAWLVATVLMFVPLLFTGLVFSWWLAPGIIMFCLSFFTSSSFRYVVLMMGLRKYGYKEKIRRVSCKAVLHNKVVGG